MPVTRRGLIGTAVLASTLPPRMLRAQGKRAIKIGVLNDMSGTYRDVSGPGSVACVRQAIQDFGGSGKDFTVDVLVGDHQNKPDVGVSITRQWFDRDGVDMVIDVPTSSVALAVANVAREKNKVYINSGGATVDLTGSQCNANTLHWTYDTYMLARSTGAATVKAGGNTWFFVTANYVFGQQLQRDASSFVTRAGGKVLGSALYPFPETTDFSSYLIQAQSSGAKVVGFANAGDDAVNSIKQAHEFGLTAGGATLAGLLVIINVVHALTLPTAQGLLLTESFYWDLNDRTRAVTSRVRPKMGNAPPNMEQAGCYSGVLHYLKAIETMGVANAKASGSAVVAQMKKMPVDDDVFGKTTVREDGRHLVPAYLFQVKKPAESKGPWDYYKLVATTPADEAAPPLADEHCPLVKS
ncbi:MAG: ABC transporter substrate-binding protein [Acetobacteraceae bacterium]|nr:ABC transporter substrate-binding protein [Acetobacteraceae bacterium]